MADEVWKGSPLSTFPAVASNTKLHSPLSFMVWQKPGLGSTPSSFSSLSPNVSSPRNTKESSAKLPDSSYLIGHNYIGHNCIGS